MLYGILLFVHIVVSLILVVSVLLQSSKGGGLAGTFGGSGMTGGVFGGRGAAPLLVKATTTCAILFMLTSLSLNLVHKRSGSESALNRVRTEESAGFASEPAVTTEMPISAESPATGDTGGTEAPSSENQQ